MIQEEEIKKYVRISKQSKALADNLKDFDFNKFLKWFLKNKIVIGSGHIIEYLKKTGDKTGNQNK